MSVVIMDVNREECMTGLETALAMAEMVLFTNNIPIDEGTVLADLTLATFTGYAASAALTFAGPYKNAAGNWVLAVSCPSFIRTGGVIEETVYGWGITDMAGAVLEVAGLLDDPVAMVGVDQGITIHVEIPYGG